VNRELDDLVALVLLRPEFAAPIASAAPADAWDRIQRDRQLGELRARIETFLARHGARTDRGMIPVPSHGTWAEHPQVVIGLLQALARSGHAPRADGDDIRQFEAARATVRAALSRGLRRTLGLARVFDRSLEQSRTFVFIREGSLHEAEIGIANGRRIALEIGERLCREHRLERADDVFHLRLDELEPAAAGALGADITRERVRVRKQQHARWCAVANGGDDWVREAIGLPQRRTPPSSTGPVLTGLAASAGLARGPARVIRTQDEFHKLQSGEVLVCPATSPAWTPLFSLASAVVTDVGGPLSHAAIVAREFGIPAVLGAAHATQRIHDGDTLVVDGTAGRIEIVSDVTE
jgi:pyruvate,water dikinase